eukprot:952564-Rhodomonas_salina.1
MNQEWYSSATKGPWCHACPQGPSPPLRSPSTQCRPRPSSAAADSPAAAASSHPPRDTTVTSWPSSKDG